jgi:hypothetical protein
MLGTAFGKKKYIGDQEGFTVVVTNTRGRKTFSKCARIHDLVLVVVVIVGERALTALQCLAGRVEGRCVLQRSQHLHHPSGSPLAHLRNARKIREVASAITLSLSPLLQPFTGWSKAPMCMIARPRYERMKKY